MGMKRLLLLVAAAVVLLTACPPPITPHPPPVYPISQCKEAFPDGYTRPVPTNHNIILRPALPGVRVIIWLDRHCDHYVVGPYDPAHPFNACDYRPDLGDRYYANWDQAMFVGTPPQACPQAV
jgi:hypothetical protein